MNKYQIKQKIGVGNFAEVYSCLHKQTNQIYALKKIKIKINENQIMILDSLKNIQNVNIVKGIESFNDGRYQYLVMEYCVNGSLDDYLKKHTKFSQRIAAIIIYFTAKGLKSLHQNKIIHRDLKAANILFDSQYNIKINDFGLSKLIQSAEQILKSRVGTPLYMSPQLLSHQNYTIKTDSWSLGVLMHLLITQKYPFYKAGQNQFQFKRNVIKHELQFEKDVQNETIELIKSCLQNDENKRISINQILQSKYMENIRLDQESARKQLRRFLQKQNHSKKRLYFYEHILFEIKKKIQNKLKLYNNARTLQKLQNLQLNNLAKNHRELIKIIYYIVTTCQINVNQKKIHNLNILQLLNIENLELVKKSVYSIAQINLALLRISKQIFMLTQSQNKQKIFTISNITFFQTYIWQFIKFPLSLKINITVDDVPQTIYLQNLNNFQPISHDLKMQVVMEQGKLDQYNESRLKNVLNFIKLN